MFDNQFISIEDKGDYCEIHYKSDAIIDDEVAVESVLTRKQVTNKTKYLYVVEPGVQFTKEAMACFGKEASSEGIDIAAVCVYHASFFKYCLFYLHKHFMNIFLSLKSKPKLKFFSSIVHAKEWLAKQ